MYCLKISIAPTSAMTFRILPSSILNIATYPFVPPTTLSGYLRRLVMLSMKLEIPETDINKNNPPVYALPRKYITLGAYPVRDNFTAIHRTYRKGMREFNHDVFSRLYIEKEKADFQLHTWEYLITSELIGYVVTKSAEDLKPLQEIKGFGCKLGKEGFAVIQDISQPIKLTQITKEAIPSTIVPMEALLATNQFVNGCDIYNLYRYNWLTNQDNLNDNSPTAVNGFIPFVASYFQNQLTPELDYLTDSNNQINIPLSLINLLQLKGEITNV
ncbi:hypothetical protein [Cyanobacterium aponinum]|uniref:CRISPR-associated protein Cas5 n=1 Tax=Cyanobacterium aponinum (strain PCC 10605) TaxID=755178 RepID=K9Z6I7_CYAAP|nr:hypothetical protein [Cyanobacterium aponinum]AFZ54739.1 hypothetical protein Cyan10605_2665 [Cyanobacterium aponinum PCC 10605]